MKSLAVALATSAIVGSALASPHDRHMFFHNRRDAYYSAPSSSSTPSAYYSSPIYSSPVYSSPVYSSPIYSSSVYSSAAPYSTGESCGCTTYTTTWYGAPTLGGGHSTYSPKSTLTVYPSPVPTTSSYEYTTSHYTPVHPVPSPHVTSYPTTGTYTIPATTVTLTTTETIPYPTSTVCAPGKCTYGGVTTSVTTNTIVTCPYAHTTTSNGVVYSTITQTTYSCPSSGLYTIGPYTTTVTDTYTVEYPTVTYYNPGTYSAPEKTVTVTKTNEVYTCPYETVKPTYTPKPSTYAPKPSTYAPKPPKNTYVPPPKPTATAYQAPPHKPKHHSPPVHKPHTGPVVNGDQWAMTYTPYGNDGQCKSSSEVASDIAIIASKGFTTVRLYSTDCDTLPSVGSACEAHGIRIILGIFIDSSGISGAREQLDDIMSWGKFDMVDMVVVGNEALFNGYCTTSELAALIIEVRSSIRGAGCNAPVTTTEPLISLQEYGGDLCHAMDVVAANLQPYFNADTSAADAGDFVAGQLELVGKVCPGLEAYNLECGWPNAGGANGAAVPGYSEQAEAIKSIVAKVGSKTVIFSYQNDAWKSSGLNGVEPHFGCIDVF